MRLICTCPEWDLVAKFMLRLKFGKLTFFVVKISFFALIISFVTKFWLCYVVIPSVYGRNYMVNTMFYKVKTLPLPFKFYKVNMMGII